MKASQVKSGDKLNGKLVTEACRSQKNHIQIKTEGQRRGVIVHHSTELQVETVRPVSGDGFGK